jgi:hypothetical protein
MVLIHAVRMIYRNASRVAGRLLGYCGSVAACIKIRGLSDKSGRMKP